MAKVETINTIHVYEVDGAELNSFKSDKPSVIIKNHWNRSEFVVIEMNGAKYTVLASDLHKAICNAQNV